MPAVDIRYAQSGDVSIAYNISGGGELDIVYVPGAVSNLSVMWSHPRPKAFFDRLASFGRLIMFDKRGTGLSDQVAGVPTLEERMDDVRAVMDAVGCERAAIMGVSEGGPMTLLFAATYPERTHAAVVYGGFVRGTWSPEFPYEPTREEMEQRFREVRPLVGTPEFRKRQVERMAPSLADDESYLAWAAEYARQGASPGALIALARMNMDVDISAILPTIRVPTLIVHRTGDRACDVRAGRYMAEHVPGAVLVELPGDDHAPWGGNSDAVLDAIGRFLDETSAIDRDDDSQRVLATVLFTDIVGSTAKAVELGDRQWRELVMQHNERVRAQLRRFRGREVDTAGDGFFASGFDGPARAIRCACAVVDSVKELGLDVRAGLHTGECEVIDGKVGGIAVNIGARVAAYAQPGEVLVSSTVKDLVAGSGLEFVDRGAHELKGIPGEWRLYAVAKTA